MWAQEATAVQPPGASSGPPDGHLRPPACLRPVHFSPAPWPGLLRLSQASAQWLLLRNVLLGFLPEGKKAHSLHVLLAPCCLPS